MASDEEDDDLAALRLAALATLKKSTKNASNSPMPGPGPSDGGQIKALQPGALQAAFPGNHGQFGGEGAFNGGRGGFMGGRGSFPGGRGMYSGGRGKFTFTGGRGKFSVDRRHGGRKDMHHWQRGRNSPQKMDNFGNTDSPFMSRPQPKSSNLIVIQTVSMEGEKEKVPAVERSAVKSSGAPKNFLIRPQDKYMPSSDSNKAVATESKPKVSNKFSRYESSDSDSDDDDDDDEDDDDEEEVESDEDIKTENSRKVTSEQESDSEKEIDFKVSDHEDIVNSESENSKKLADSNVTSQSLPSSPSRSRSKSPLAVKGRSRSRSTSPPLNTTAHAKSPSRSPSLEKVADTHSDLDSSLTLIKEIEKLIEEPQVVVSTRGDLNLKRSASPSLQKDSDPVVKVSAKVDSPRTRSRTRSPSIQKDTSTVKVGKQIPSSSSSSSDSAISDSDSSKHSVPEHRGYSKSNANSKKKESRWTQPGSSNDRERAQTKPLQLLDSVSRKENIPGDKLLSDKSKLPETSKCVRRTEPVRVDSEKLEARRKKFEGGKEVQLDGRSTKISLKGIVSHRKAKNSKSNVKRTSSDKKSKSSKPVSDGKKNNIGSSKVQKKSGAQSDSSNFSDSLSDSESENETAPWRYAHTGKSARLEENAFHRSEKIFERHSQDIERERRMRLSNARVDKRDVRPRDSHPERYPRESYKRPRVVHPTERHPKGFKPVKQSSSDDDSESSDSEKPPMIRSLLSVVKTDRGSRGTTPVSPIAKKIQQSKSFSDGPVDSSPDRKRQKRSAKSNKRPSSKRVIVTDGDARNIIKKFKHTSESEDDELQGNMTGNQGNSSTTINITFNSEPELGENMPQSRLSVHQRLGMHVKRNPKSSVQSRLGKVDVPFIEDKPSRKVITVTDEPALSLPSSKVKKGASKKPERKEVFSTKVKPRKSHKRDKRKDYDELSSDPESGLPEEYQKCI